MIAGKRQAGTDNLWRPVRQDGIRRQGIANDLVILFGAPRGERDAGIVTCAASVHLVNSTARKRVGRARG
jgi:hypothetical protein